jgi:hypothetical protein
MAAFLLLHKLKHEEDTHFWIWIGKRNKLINYTYPAYELPLGDNLPPFIVHIHILYPTHGHSVALQA